MPQNHETNNEETAHEQRSGGEGPQTTTQTPGAGSSIMAFLKSNSWESVLWMLRLMVLFFSINFVLPIFGFSPSDSFQKAFLANMAANAIRLRARAPVFTSWREYLSRVLMEDSTHYLLYSLMFFTSLPNTMVVIPIFLFAVLHVQSYTRQVLNSVGPEFGMFLRRMMDKLSTQQQSVLRFIALIEVFMMVQVILMVFTGGVSILVPFLYYRFLTMRYVSQRNPYCRQVFFELRLKVQELSQNPRCPEFIRNLLMRGVDIVCKLAPPIATAAAS